MFTTLTRALSRNLSGITTYATSVHSRTLDIHADRIQYIRHRTREFLASGSELVLKVPDYKVKREFKPDELKRWLKHALAERALLTVMDDFRREGRGVYYSIAPEYIGPVIEQVRKTDPVMPFYRNTGFLLSRAWQLGMPLEDILRDIIRGYMCSSQDPNGGRHRLNTHPELYMEVPTPAIGTDMPKMLGLCSSFRWPKMLGFEGKYDSKSIGIIGAGDGSMNHPTILSSLNYARRLCDDVIPLPMMIVINDNGLSLATQNRYSLKDEMIRTGFPVYIADSRHVLQVAEQADTCQKIVRQTHKPGILIIKSHRLFGHSANKRDERLTQDELETIFSHDPLPALMQLGMNRGAWDKQYCMDQMLFQEDIVLQIASKVEKEPKQSFHTIIKPEMPAPILEYPLQQEKLFTLSKMVRDCLDIILREERNAVLLGQDLTPGHYGTTMNLDKNHPGKVRSLYIDEVALGGFGNGLSMNELLPIIEFSYLAYFHEGGFGQFYEGQLQRFLSTKWPTYGAIIRMTSYGGNGMKPLVGGPTHGESFPIESLVPNAITFSPGTPLATAITYDMALAFSKTGRQSVIKEPTAQYFTTEKDYPGQCEILFRKPSQMAFRYGDLLAYEFDADDNLIVNVLSNTSKRAEDDAALHIYTFANGVELSIHAMWELRKQHPNKKIRVLENFCMTASSALVGSAELNKVLIVDECREPLSPGASWYKKLVHDAAHPQENIKLLNSPNSFFPSGPSQKDAAVKVEEIINAAESLLDDSICRPSYNNLC